MKLLRPFEASRETGIGEHAIRRLVKEGKVSAFREEDRRGFRVDIEEVLKYFETLRITPKPVLTPAIKYDSRIIEIPYPEVPWPLRPAARLDLSLPESAGVYFIWELGVVRYVGQSINIRKRVNFQAHSAVQPGDFVSWIQFPQADLNFAEAFYIGICRPERNFGGSRKAQAQKVVAIRV